MAEPIELGGFGGAVRALNPRLLAEHVGVDVVDAEPGGNELKPLRDRLTVATVPAGTRTIYRQGRDVPDDARYWLSWPGEVSVMRSLDPQDTTERIFFTGAGDPQWTDSAIGLAGGPPYPQATRRFGLPAPPTAATVALVTDGAAEGAAGDQFYVHTFVNDLGWESAPSPVSTALRVKPGAIVDLNNLPAAPAGNYGINRRRIYRTQPGTGDSAANFLFLREVTIGTTSTRDDARRLGELLPTVGLLPLPTDAKSLLGLWNGMAAFITGKLVCITEPDAPYGSRVRNDHAIADTPVALAKWEQNLLVLTTGRSVLLQGQDPEGMSETGLSMGYPCVSARSVVSFPHGVVWASSDGLAYSGAPELVTSGIIKPRQWRELAPATMVASRYGRHYVASYTVGGVQKALMFDPLRPTDGLWFLSSGFDGCFYDPLAGALYVLEGTAVRKFDAAEARLTATYRSKVFRQRRPRNFSWARVVADSYPASGTLVRLKVWADGVLRFDAPVKVDAAQSLPSGFLATDWQIEVSSPVPVQAAHLATDVGDLRGL